MIVDAGSHLLLPGFNDAHVCFSTAECNGSIQLNDASSAQEFAPHRGKSQDHSSGRMESWRRLGRNKSGIRLNSRDGHMGLANSVALRLAKIDASIPDVPGGEIARDEPWRMQRALV